MTFNIRKGNSTLTVFMAHVLYAVLLLSSYVGFTLVMQEWAPAHCVLLVGDCWSSKAWQGNTWTASGRRFSCGFPAY